MIRQVVFDTPGLLDLNAITTFGINSKPNSENPIGFFGTGLKYAIAVLVRSGCEPVLWIDNTRYVFYVKEEQFRNKTFSFVYMRKGNVSKWFTAEHKLPFTTELGKNWDLWQAFRELHSNTLDESGSTSCDVRPHSGTGQPPRGNTRILVADDAFAEVYDNRDDIFLPEALTAYTYLDGDVQYFKGPSDYIYYRGLRVYDLPKSSVVTYNILSPVTLTEDRTLKNPGHADSKIMELLTHSKDREFISDILAAGVDTYEGSLNFNNVWQTPSEEFREIVTTFHKAQKAHNYNVAINPTAHTFVEPYMPKAPVVKQKIPFSMVIDHLADAIENHSGGTVDDIIDENRNEIVAFLRKRNTRNRKERISDDIDRGDGEPGIGMHGVQKDVCDGDDILF